MIKYSLTKFGRAGREKYLALCQGLYAMYIKPNIFRTGPTKLSQ